MDNSLFSSIQRIEQDNPEQSLQIKNGLNEQQIKCRICHETKKPKKPLVSICACIGTIQYVHEQCILDWIAKKIQNTGSLEIPNCQICHQKFSAKLKIGKQKLSYFMLFDKLKLLQKKQFLQVILHLIMFLFCIFTISAAFYRIYNYFEMQDIPSQGQVFSSISAALQFIFTNIIIQIYGIIHFFSYLSTKRKWLKQSMVHIVEIMLQPKIIYK